jgi:hypothetical protein
VYCSAGSTTSSGLKGLTSAVGALRVIDPFSIHNICLSVYGPYISCRSSQGHRTLQYSQHLSICEGPTSNVGALGVIEPFSIYNICQ